MTRFTAMAAVLFALTLAFCPVAGTIFVAAADEGSSTESALAEAEGDSADEAGVESDGSNADAESDGTLDDGSSVESDGTSDDASGSGADAEDEEDAVTTSTSYDLAISTAVTKVSSSNAAAKKLTVSVPVLTATTTTVDAEGNVLDTQTVSTSYKLTVQVHVRNKGWCTASLNASGTAYTYTASKASSGSYIQAVRIKPSAELKAALSKAGLTFYYRATTKYFGTLGWAKAGYAAGTTGNSNPLTGLKLKVIKTSNASNYSTANRYISTPRVTYRTTYTGKSSWSEAKTNAATSGKAKVSSSTIGKIAVKISSSSPATGSIKVSVRTSKSDSASNWSSYAADYATAGSKNSKIKAIKIKLTGAMATYYDVYYRVYVPGYGWLDWAKNGAKAGTKNSNFSISAVQIKLVRKGASAPGSTATPFRTVASATSLSSASWATVKAGITAKLGTSYRYGGRATKAWDCSGFVSYIMHTYYGTAWPGGSWGYSGSSAIASYCEKKGSYVCKITSASSYSSAVSSGKIQPGDILVFYRSGSRAVHVAIVGEGTYIYHAPNTKYDTCMQAFSTVWKQNTYRSVKVYRGL